MKLINDEHLVDYINEALEEYRIFISLNEKLLVDLTKFEEVFVADYLLKKYDITLSDYLL